MGHGRLRAAARPQEVVDEVGMRPAMAASLQERQVVGVLDRGGLREHADALWKQVPEVGHRDTLRNPRLGQRLRGRAPGVNDRLLTFDLLPFERLLRSVHVEAFAVLPRRVEQAARDLRADVRIAKLERGRLDGKGTAVPGDEGFGDASGPMADHVLGMLAGQGEARADAVRRVVHGGKALPVPRPPFHILLVAAPHELNAAQLAGVVQPFHEQVLSAVDDGLHHHVDLAALALPLDDLAALLDGRAGRHGAGDVLAGFQRRDRLRRLVRDPRVGVNRVDLRVLQEVLIARIPGLHAEAITAGVQLYTVPPAYGSHTLTRLP